MALQKKRYYTWLLKAYFKRWKKTILGAIAISVFASIGIFALVVFYIMPLIEDNQERIGYSGVYTIQNLPDEVINQISMGLVKVEEDGSISPAAAKSWEINNNTEYIFHLREDLEFHNGIDFSARTIPFNYENVRREVIDDYTIRFTLEEPYAPFLTAVSEPILLRDYSGLGQYEIENIELNAEFVSSITMRNSEPPHEEKIVTFYQNEEALKTAFTLGEIDVARNITDKTLNNSYDLTSWPKVELQETVNKNVMITVFFNTSDSILSDKRIRQALHYALPSEMEFGKRLYSPIKESSIYFEKPPNYGIADKELAREILESASEIEGVLNIKAATDLEQTAKIVQKNWTEIGVNSEMELVSELPQDFQVLIYEMKVPEDPDQYILWHSDQRNNIVDYKNLRIDKLLEDGRSVSNIEDRQEIYADFQKYLMDDLPASFFYHPKVYKLYREN